MGKKLGKMEGVEEQRTRGDVGRGNKAGVRWGWWETVEERGCLYCCR